MGGLSGSSSMTGLNHSMAHGSGENAVFPAGGGPPVGGEVLRMGGGGHFPAGAGLPHTYSNQSLGAVSSQGGGGFPSLPQVPPIIDMHFCARR